MTPDHVPLSRGLALAAAIGLLLGVATQVGQSLLPAGVGQIANSISPWLTVAFAVGAFQARARNAAAAGFVSLAMALVGYYAMVFVRFGYTTGGSTLALWTVAALAGGAVFDPGRLLLAQRHVLGPDDRRGTTGRCLGRGGRLPRAGPPDDGGRVRLRADRSAGAA